MIKNFEDVQKLSQSNLDNTMKLFGDWSKSWQALAARLPPVYAVRFMEA